MRELIERQAAIDAIHCNIVVTGRENAELVAKTMGEFVDRIKALPTVQPEVLACGNGELVAKPEPTDEQVAEYCKRRCLHVVTDDFFHTVQPEPKKGEWKMEPDPYGFFEEIPVCSGCGCTTEMRKTYNFCPNCGADMRGEKDG